ncbi:hypothetical protein D5R81_18745 [Parashewanella spongiae]|uniref:Nucleotidyltransferase n=1 Tax=Parashewanella spongiae TaxID=342950 RepID=A0A3A6T6Q8_9GAMM|nr:hypothetical protein [Parashewanella spongiae]MCL1080069.1 hypothetical protein [Parashewanella spongiae]RJY05101.1 hypothetical protein D5R81_18745 [Parashewanella spongiae]
MPKQYKTKLSKPVAHKKLFGLLERIQFWNNEYSEYYQIEKAALVGSLTRDGERFGDIDVCIDLKRSKKFNPADHSEDYIYWRQEVLGYAPPRDFFAELSMYDKDVFRFVKNKDGRIELLRWNQFDPICLTLKPFVTLVENGVCLVNSISDLAKNKNSFTAEQALELVKNDTPHKPNEICGIYWDSYCQSLSVYPASIRNAILKRDSAQERYDAYLASNNDS